MTAVEPWSQPPQLAEEALRGFTDYLAEQVEDLRCNLDAWVRAHLQMGKLHGGDVQRPRLAQPQRVVNGQSGRRGHIPVFAQAQEQAVSVPVTSPLQALCPPRRASDGLATMTSDGFRPVPVAIAPPQQFQEDVEPWVSEISEPWVTPEESRPSFLSPCGGHVSDTSKVVSVSDSREVESILDSCDSSAAAPAERVISMQLRKSGGTGFGSAVSLVGLMSNDAARKVMTSGAPIPGRLTNRNIMSLVQRFLCDWLFVVVVLLNVLVMGVRTEWSPEWIGWTGLDAAFAAYFLIDLLVSMRAIGVSEFFLGRPHLGRRCRVFSDDSLRWRWFESFLVALALIELAIKFVLESASVANRFGILRVVRLMRAARILRVCRLTFFAELVMMVNGAIGGMRTLAWSMALIAMPLYFFALIMNESVGDKKGPAPELFSTLSQAWFTMFRCSVAADCSTAQGHPIILLLVDRFGPWYALLFTLTTILMSVGLSNVIAAIFVENTLAAAKAQSTLQVRQRLMDTERFAEKVGQLVRFVWSVHLCHKADPDWQENHPNLSERTADGIIVPMSDMDIEEAAGLQITPEFFDVLRTFPEFKEVLRELDISDEDQVDLFNTLDVDGGGTLDLDEMIIGMSKLRGGPRRSDIVSVGLVVRSIQADVKRIRKLVASLEHRRSETAMVWTPTNRSSTSIAG